MSVDKPSKQIRKTENKVVHLSISHQHLRKAIFSVVTNARNIIMDYCRVCVKIIQLTQIKPKPSQKYQNKLFRKFLEQTAHYI